ncbi:hypothetical protein KR026_004263 [Drosophila bipectinata]|nr:hypothetical protein KR026_004263 [Drosophila bipectinata]
MASIPPTGLPSGQTQPINSPLLPPPPTGQNIAPTGAFPGSLTPGWNDPPPISGGAMASGGDTRRPRLDLRKRVAHPLSGQQYQQPQSNFPAPALDQGSPRPVAMVPPQRQLPVQNHGSFGVGAGAGMADASGFSGIGGVESPGGNVSRPPPLASELIANPSKVPVAIIPPRAK